MIFEQAQRLTEVLLALAVQAAGARTPGRADPRSWVVRRAGHPRVCRCRRRCARLHAGCAARRVHGKPSGIFAGRTQRWQRPHAAARARLPLALTSRRRRPGKQIFLGYLAVQVLLSYVVAGVVKLVNPGVA